MTNEDDSWLEGGDADASPAQSGRGELVTKSRITSLFAYSPGKVDRAIADGAPVVSKGTRKQGWKINTADFHQWIVRRERERAGGDADPAGFEAAKTRNMEAQARERELKIAEREGRLVQTENANALMTKILGELRAGVVSLPSQIMGLPPEWRDQLDAAVHNILTEISTKKADFDAAMAQGKEEPSEP